MSVISDEFSNKVKRGSIKLLFRSTWVLPVSGSLNCMRLKFSG
jgi:hypothetical protein